MSTDTVAIDANLPPLQQRRALVEQKRDQFRAMAFDADIEADCVMLQVHGNTDGARKKGSRELKDKALNCYASATALDEKLRELDALIAAEKAKAPENEGESPAPPE